MGNAATEGLCGIFAAAVTSLCQHLQLQISVSLSLSVGLNSTPVVNEDDLEVAHQSTLPLHVNTGSESLPPSPSQAEKAFLLIASKTLTVFSNGFHRAPQPRYCVCQGEDTDE